MALVAAAAVLSSRWWYWPLPVEALTATGTPAALPAWAAVSIIIFVVATVSSTVGFAFSAIAASAILYYVPNGVEAVQIMMIASIGLQTYSVADLFRAINWPRCAPFIAGGITTLPIGVFLLIQLQARTYALMMSGALIVYGLVMLLRCPFLVKGSILADAGIGAIGGITGPLAALPGIWVTIWCGMRGWNKVAQRAVYQPYILIMQVLAFAALSCIQPVHPFDVALLAYALPGLAGAIVGLRIFRAMSDPQFQRLISVSLVVSGITLVIRHAGP
jgi:uncharacterized membrane protein YfcA